jgi:hypothetical protein
VVAFSEVVVNSGLTIFAKKSRNLIETSCLLHSLFSQQTQLQKGKVVVVVVVVVGGSLKP